MFNAYNLGTKSLSRKDICNQAYKLTKSSFKTVDNTLGALVNRRVLVHSKHGHYALAPAQLRHLNSLKPTGGKESKPIDITSVVNVPDTIPEGKEVENYQTPLFATGLDLLLPFLGRWSPNNHRGKIFSKSKLQCKL